MTVTVTLTNTSPVAIPSDFTLHLSAFDLQGRFYIFEKTLSDSSPNVTITQDFHSLNSLRRYELNREGLTLAPGQTETLTWRVWIQPSIATRFDALLVAQGQTHLKSAEVDRAAGVPARDPGLAAATRVLYRQSHARQRYSRSLQWQLRSAAG